MQLVFTMQHPADANQFRYAIEELRDAHDVSVFVRDRGGIVSAILSEFGIDHEVLADQSSGLLNLLRAQVVYEARLLARARELDPDVVVATGGLAASHVATVVGCESVVFTDTEHATVSNLLTFPFADTVCTPDCYRGDVGAKQVRYPSYHELAYLHPNRFEPDERVLEHVDADPDERVVIVRQIAWEAVHDVGDGGFERLESVVARLEDEGAHVLVSAEGDLPEPLAEYELDVPTGKFHDLLACADLYVGESPTMAAESAVLGTPAIFVSTSTRGYTDELECEYGLVFSFSGADRHAAGLDAAVSILADYDPAEWEARRERLLREKTDATAFVLEAITARDTIDERTEPRHHAETVL